MTYHPSVLDSIRAQTRARLRPAVAGTVLTAFGLLLLVGCGSEEPRAADDEDGELVATTAEADADQCEHGGTVITIGVDETGDGTIDADEQTTVVCDGRPGDDGGDGQDGADADCADVAPLEIDADIEETPYHRVGLAYTVTVAVEGDPETVDVLSDATVEATTESDGTWTTEVTFHDDRPTQLTALATDGCQVAVDRLDVDVYPPPYEKLDGSMAHTCGLRADGTIDCWGVGGQSPFLSEDLNLDPLLTPPADDDFVDVSVGIGTACGHHEDGTATCWTMLDDGQSHLEGLPEDYPLETIDAGIAFCGLPSGDTASCHSTQIDSGTVGVDELFPDHDDPQFADFGFYLFTIFGGNDEFAVLLEDGRAYFVEAFAEEPEPVELLPGENFDRMDVDLGAFCGINAEEYLQCEFAILEDDDDDFLDETSDSSGAESINAGSTHGCASFDDGSVECIGEVPSEDLVGDDDFDPDELDETVFDVPQDYEFTDVATGFLHVCGLTEQHEVVCWGDVVLDGQEFPEVTDPIQ